MLAEWLAALTVTTASSAARRLGYAHELTAIEARHRRCREAWFPHLQRTRRGLLEAARPYADEQRSAVILGGGVVEDVPLAELAALFRQVCLVDIAFSRHTRRLAHASKGKVMCLPVDVTGCCEAVWQDMEIPFSALDNDPLPAGMLDDAAWVASVNCLTQLPLLLAQHLLRRGFAEDEVERLGVGVMQAHLRLIRRWGKPWCLVAEYRDRRLDRDGVAIAGTDYGSFLNPWIEATSAQLMDRWDWWVHPPGELPKGEREVRSVGLWASGSGSETARLTL